MDRVLTSCFNIQRFGSTKKVFNEADYIAILPCIYGHQVITIYRHHEYVDDCANNHHKKYHCKQRSPLTQYHPQAGLQTPFNLTADTNITAIKYDHHHESTMVILATRYFNNTHRHLGQMAQWTGLMVYDTDPY